MGSSAATPGGYLHTGREHVRILNSAAAEVGDTRSAASPNWQRRKKIPLVTQRRRSELLPCRNVIRDRGNHGNQFGQAGNSMTWPATGESKSHGAAPTSGEGGPRRRREGVPGAAWKLVRDRARSSAASTTRARSSMPSGPDGDDDVMIRCWTTASRTPGTARNRSGEDFLAIVSASVPAESRTPDPVS